MITRSIDAVIHELEDMKKVGMTDVCTKTGPYYYPPLIHIISLDNSTDARVEHDSPNSRMVVEIF